MNHEKMGAESANHRPQTKSRVLKSLPNKSVELKINHSFRDLIPPLSEWELAGLEEELRFHGGCYSPIITWNSFIVDGHNRYEICTRHKLRIKSEEMDFEDEDDAKLFIYKNQLKRRNLEEPAKVKISLGIEEIEKKKAEKRMKSGGYECKGSVKYPRDKVPQGESETGKVRDIIGKRAGVSGKTVDRFKYIQEKADPKIVQSLCDGEKINNKKLTIGGVFNDIKKKEMAEILESIEAKEIKATQGIYDVVVIDPPWDIKKIGLDVRPNQAECLDYPTMSIEEIKELKVPCAKDCHVFLWTTQKYLRASFDIIESWGLISVCTFVWHKDNGFQPFNLPKYNAEFILYAHKGNPQFIDLKNFKIAFHGKSGRHSEKPEGFYDMIRRVTAGRRLDMFNRRKIKGFEGWGNESTG